MHCFAFLLFSWLGCAITKSTELTYSEIVKELKNLTTDQINNALQNETVSQHKTDVRTNSTLVEANSSCLSCQIVSKSAGTSPTTFDSALRNVLSYLTETPTDRFNVSIFWEDDTNPPAGTASVCVSHLTFETNWVLYLIFGSITLVAIVITVTLVLSLGRGQTESVTYGQVQASEDDVGLQELN